MLNSNLLSIKSLLPHLDSLWRELPGPTLSETFLGWEPQNNSDLLFMVNSDLIEHGEIDWKVLGQRFRKTPRAVQSQYEKLRNHRDVLLKTSYSGLLCQIPALNGYLGTWSFSDMAKMYHRQQLDVESLDKPKKRPSQSEPLRSKTRKVEHLDSENIFQKDLQLKLPHRKRKSILKPFEPTEINSSSSSSQTAQCDIPYDPLLPPEDEAVMILLSFSNSQQENSLSPYSDL